MDIFVADRHDVERGIRIRTSYALISISDPGLRPPRPHASSLCRDVLRLRFHDSEPVEGHDLPAHVRLMTKAQARAIWRFVLEWRDQVGAVVVHCEGGVSRSPAVAAAICGILGQDNARFFREYQPNRYIYELMLSTAPLSE